MSLRVIIADDEPLNLDMFRVLLSELQPHFEPIEITAECRTGEATLDAVDANAPDILFLDINMPAGDGMMVAEAVARTTATPPQIIFTTAHAEYAAQAFDLEAADYLLKPIRADRLRRAIERAIAKLALTADDPPNRMIPVPGVGGVDMVDASWVEWAEASGDYVSLRVNDRNLMVRKTLSSLAAFAFPVLRRTHRSYLVNLDFVVKVIPRPKGEALLCVKSGAEIPVSRKYREVIKNLLA